ncbi:hypothetical protein [Paenibacillus apiarius]|uniref:Uncharacterized protein n=1 Tax=Paenibacillus apiarius TaxID=46240 RepID=A0ABT4E436_9BACL|nr:hypothetical protein [Paenibacillus apiarius]MCY9517029.1 hypothetical protein [Paenibacillus apiarius]MCY9523263.1 hypothetical protein [Paenibacillus apiarius]MCY9554239.1 hypothetical protein [Paenibacillus apiarius]MCY9560850.1 hypothetical protein [Paenibacillus apiarius]MCY9682771.1 hypothetical protein [Paenibacillus apiarius]
MKFNKKSIAIVIGVLLAVSGTSVYASATYTDLFRTVTFSDLFPTESSEEQSEVQFIQDTLEKSWKKGLDQIISQTNSSATTFTVDSYTVLNHLEATDDSFLSKLSTQEKSSFLAAYYSEERRKNLDVGDYMPALMLSKDGLEAKQYWEKKDGSIIVIDLKTKNEDGDNLWYVSDNAKILNSN